MCAGFKDERIINYNSWIWANLTGYIMIHLNVGEQTTHGDLLFYLLITIL
jgi:hypothetical protein